MAAHILTVQQQTCWLGFLPYCNGALITLYKCLLLSPLFVSQEWTKFEKIGEQMIHLAKSISDIAQNSFRKQVKIMGLLLY